MIKTKIVATLGPASSDVNTIQSLIDHGVNVFRLNFSHGDFASHQKVLDAINHCRTKTDTAVAVMGDLCGPKIRITTIEPEGEWIKKGQQVIIEPSLETGTIHHFGTNYQDLVNDVKPGQRILINDGQIALEVKDINDSPAQAICTVLVGGELLSRKGINLPDSNISIPAITERDWECVDWAIEHDLDYLALSFVRTAEEVAQLKNYLDNKGSQIRVVSKLEKPQAIANLEAILHVTDAAMIARGDLGVEMNLAEVPLIQKRITHLCRKLGKPVIVATQMLQSMIDAPVPTRAEVSDVANAMMDMTDAVMLSGETAVGKYPIETIESIKEIARKTEAFLDELDDMRPHIEAEDELITIEALSRSIAQIIDSTDIKFVATWSDTGATARYLSKSRIDVPVVAFSDNQLTCRQMCMCYGIIPYLTNRPEGLDAFLKMTDTIIREKGWAKQGEKIILMPGKKLASPLLDHSILLHTLT